jgi:hypothetical protein
LRERFCINFDPDAMNPLGQSPDLRRRAGSDFALAAGLRSPQRAAAACAAISFRRFAESDAALAGPPFRPIAAAASLSFFVMVHYSPIYA